MPYWQAQFDCTLDSENLEESMVYKKLNELEKKPSAFMAHHRPDDLASDKRGLATYINENYGEGETVLYCHGHLGDNGVTVEKNANGADVIFVNSNNNHDGGTNPYLVAYDTKVEDGKVIAIKKMKMRYKKAA